MNKPPWIPNESLENEREILDDLLKRNRECFAGFWDSFKTFLVPCVIDGEPKFIDLKIYEQTRTENL
jgi:hypothetical protein